MAMPDIKGTGADPTHHVVLYDGATELGFVVTDQGGDLDERTFRRFPFADPVQPYVTEKQNSFGAGFGQHKFEENRSRYWLSDGVDTTKDQIVLAPRFHYASGAFEQSFNNLEVDGEYSHSEILTADRYYATEFTPALTFDELSYVKLFIGRTGTPPANLNVHIYSDSGGDPNSSLVSYAITPASVDEEDGQWIRIPMTYGPGLSSGTKYHLVVESSGGTGGGDTGNHWHVLRGDTDVQGSKKSTNGSSWLAGDGDIYFRVEGSTDNESATMRFFEYKDQLYTVQSFDNSLPDQLYMNGWRGAADNNVLDLTLLMDSTNTDWASKIAGDEVVEIVAGPTSGKMEDYRPVDLSAGGGGLLDNGELPVYPDWANIMSTEDDYVVKGSNWWQKITNFVPMKKVSDVGVAKGNVYFCRTNQWKVLLHREHNLDGTWKNSTTDEWRELQQFADHVQPVRDPVGGHHVWFGTNSNKSNDRRPEVCRSEAREWEDVTLNYANVLPIYKDEWVMADSDIAKFPSVWSMIGFMVKVNKVLTVAIDQPGSTYTNGDYDVTIVDVDSSNSAQVNVTVSGGQVTSINSYGERGYNYTLGVKTVTGLAGGDGQARLEITALDGFNGTGLLGYWNIVDRDGSADTYDIRYMDRFSPKAAIFVNWDGRADTNSLNAGDIELVFDDQLNAASPFVNLDFPAMKHFETFQRSETNYLDAPSNLPDLEGAGAVASVGINLAVAQTRSFTVILIDDITAYNDSDVVEVGHRDGDDITGLNTYGDPEELWVFTESGMGAVANNRYKPVPLRELLVAHHPNNGVGNEVHDVYLLFTWRGRLQRFFRQNLEDLGPEFPAGMSDIAGVVVDVATYPGRIYVAVDGGVSGKSLILCHKGGAWHEVYTSFTGERIRKLFIQAIPGKSDRLWASVGTGIMWFPISLNSVELEANSDYRYRPEGHLITSWVYTGDMELNKLFRSVVIVSDRANDADLNVEVKYQIDDEDNAWVLMDNVTDLNASAKEYHFSDGTAGQSIQGNRVRLRISIHTHDSTKTPVVRSVQYRIYKLPEVRYAWSWIAKASNISINLRGDEERSLGTQTTVLAAVQKLDSWASNMTQLTVDSSISAFDGRTVLTEPIPYQLLTLVNDEGIEEDVIQITVNDI
jgi:hypothetical protein